MRQIIFDTETTGLDPGQGHRIIEIAGVELVDRRPTGRNIHFYVNPEREIDTGATDVHGIIWEDLKEKPRFCEIAGELVEFARGAQWIIHNAPFDLAFLDAEFSQVGLPRSVEIHVGCVDTLALARDQFPGKKNSLDALCERFGVANAHRTLHGALLDAQLLAEVYLAMTRGQESLTIELAAPSLVVGGTLLADELGPILVLQPSAAELVAHLAYLAELDREARGKCLWLMLEREQAPNPA